MDINCLNLWFCSFNNIYMSIMNVERTDIEKEYVNLNIYGKTIH